MSSSLYLGWLVASAPYITYESHKARRNASGQKRRSHVTAPFSRLDPPPPIEVLLDRGPPAVAPPPPQPAAATPKALQPSAQNPVRLITLTPHRYQVYCPLPSRSVSTHLSCSLTQPRHQHDPRQALKWSRCCRRIALYRHHWPRAHGGGCCRATTDLPIGVWFAGFKV